MKDFDSGGPSASPFLARLAGSPLLVVGVTLAIGVVVTGALMLAVPMDSVAIVTTLATVWGLDLALVIYLLTAKDTDKLLAHIDALQDQLSAALEGPGPDAVVVEGPQMKSTKGASAPHDIHHPDNLHGDEETTTVPPAIPAQPGPSLERPVQPTPSPGPPTPPTPPGPTPKAHPHPSHTHGTTPVPEPQSASEPLPVTAYMPKAYVEALRNQLRMETEDIVRAWTPNPHGNGPWVVEDAKGDRWSVFQGRRDQPTVISLESRERLRQIREEKQEVRQRLHDENQQLRRQSRDEEQQRIHAIQEARTHHTPRSTR